MYHCKIYAPKSTTNHCASKSEGGSPASARAPIFLHGPRASLVAGEGRGQLGGGGCKVVKWIPSSSSV
jgi:hypothetical protein